MTNTEYIDMVSKLMKGSRNYDYWKRVKKEFKNISCQSLFDALSVMEVGYLLEEIKPQKKLCYRNALLTACAFHCDYVEGFVNINGFPIEHAFCKKNGIYFDPTLEVVDITLDVKKLSYTSIYERDYKEVVKIANELEMYGPFASHEYSQQKIKV